VRHTGGTPLLGADNEPEQIVIGAIVGDIVGSAYEHHAVQSRDFPLFTGMSRFTDDTVLTVATAAAILSDGDYATAYHAYGNRYPRAGYGGAFRDWLQSSAPRPYESWGNGSAMRVSPVGWAFETEDEVLREAARSAAVTHSHPEGIKGAQAVALGILFGRQRRPKAEIRRELTQRFGYDLARTVESIRPTYGFDVSCAGSVPEAIVAFVDADDVEDAIRGAIWLGGDADTQAAIAGSLAESWHGGVPAALSEPALARLTDELRTVVEQFRSRYPAAGSALP
jgi:ADP-ribosylglycohydrolase